MKRRSFVSLPALAVVPSVAPSVVAAVAPPVVAVVAPPASAIPATAADGATAEGAAASALAYESPGIVAGNLPAFYGALADELTFPLAWGTSPIRHFRDLAAGRPARWSRKRSASRSTTTAFEPELLDERDGGGYLQRTLTFNVTRHSRVRAVDAGAATARGRSRPCCCCTTTARSSTSARRSWSDPGTTTTRLASAQAWSDRFFGGRFVGDDLVARGYAVLAVDALGWGDRSGLTYEAQQALASNLFNLGSSLSGLMAAEDARAAAFLATLPEVDRRRIAAVGFSMGGYRAWQVSALSRHIAAAASICWMTTLKDMMVPGNNTLRGQSAYWMLHPGLSRHLDIPDVASIAAPKPALFFNGELDTLFPVAGVTGAYDKMRAVWGSQRASDRLHTRLWPELGHVFVPEMQQEVYGWLDRWLRA